MSSETFPLDGQPLTPESTARRRVDRRAVLLGAGALAVAAASAAIGRGAPGNGSPPPRPAVRAVGIAESTPPSTPTAPVASPPARRVRISIGTAPVPTPAPRGGVPDGMALVTSPRLPLFGVGPDDPVRLLRGEVDGWRRVGSPVSLAVEPLALKGEAFPGAQPIATVADYDALVAALTERPGGVALVPLDEVDFRVNVLSIGTADPLRDREDDGEPTLRIGVAGDIVPGRNVHQHMVKYGDFTRPFRKVAPLLSGYDLTFANLEGNLSSTLSQPADPHSTAFVSDPSMLDGFKLAGIDAVTLANNHSVYSDEGWGLQGLLDTVDALDGAGVPYFGAGRTLDEARAPWSTTVKGRTIALLGVDGVTANREIEPGIETGVLDFDAAATATRPGTNPYVSDQVLADITAAAGQADVVIPYFHMGREYVAVPPGWVVDAARAAVDAGATLVVTLHPHVIQGMEVYKGRPIIYSPGNFVFDQMFSAEVRSGYVLDLTIRGGRVVGLRCHGVEIEEFHQPRPMTAGEQAGLMDRFWSATDRLAARAG